MLFTQRLMHILVVIVLGCGTVVSQTEDAKPGPVSIPTEHDWGNQRLPKEMYYEARIPVSNTAKKGDLTITEVKPGCGCTTAEPETRTLKPGQTTHINVRLNVTESQGGPLTKSLRIVTVHNNDTINSMVMLKVHVDRPLVFSPTTFVAYNDVPAGVESAGTLTLTNPTKNAITLSAFEIQNNFKSDLTEGMVLKSGESRTVTFRITPAVAGNVYGSIRFKASGFGDPETFLVTAYGTAK